MPKKISVSVKESISELEGLLKKVKSERARGRIKALLLLKKEKVSYQLELARKIGFTEKTVREWLKRYEREGLASCIKIRVGGNGKSTITDEARLIIAEKLNDAHTNITSYTELLEVLKEEYQFDIKYKTLYGFCRRHHQSKLKVARKSHYKKDEQALEAFKKTTPLS